MQKLQAINMQMYTQHKHLPNIRVYVGILGWGIWTTEYEKNNRFVNTLIYYTDRSPFGSAYKLGRWKIGIMFVYRYSTHYHNHFSSLCWVSPIIILRRSDRDYFDSISRRLHWLHLVSDSDKRRDGMHSDKDLSSYQVALFWMVPVLVLGLISSRLVFIQTTHAFMPRFESWAIA